MRSALQSTRQPLLRTHFNWTLRSSPFETAITHSCREIDGRSNCTGVSARRRCDAARFLSLTPPLLLPARAPYGALAATSVAILPG